MANFLPLHDGELPARRRRAHRRPRSPSSPPRDAERLDAYGDAARRDRRRAARARAGDAAQRRRGRLARGAAGAARSRRRSAGGSRRLDITARRDLLALFAQSAGDWLDGWFESEPIKAAYGFDGVVGNYASPYTPGSAYVLLHHVFGEVNGKKGAWGHAIGGMGAITQAMAEGCGRARRRHPRRRAGARGARRERPRGRRGHRGGRDARGPGPSSPTSIRSCSSRSWSTRPPCRPISASASPATARAPAPSA